MHIYFLFIYTIFILSGGCVGLKNMSLKVPVAVKAGDRLRIRCEYDLENAALYSVKFYQGDTEFYRFVPKESPPSRVFPLHGIQVDLSRSNSTVVTLDKVQRDLTGYYKCEVSADAPFFHTAEQSAPVIVIEEPLLLPRLNVEKSKYSANERIRANCTSEAGFPAANLTWLINNMQLRENPPMIRMHNRLLSDNVRTLETSVSMLELEARPGYFHEGKLQLSCLATQYSLYARNASVTLLEDSPQLAPVMGATAPHSHLESRASLLASDGPVLWAMVLTATVLTR